MASITLSLFALIFTSLIFSVLGQDNLRCYNCESEGDKGCADPVDVSGLQVLDCNSLTYHPAPRQEDSRSITDQVLSHPKDGQFRGGPVIEDIFEGNVAERSQKTYKYVCLKVVLTADDLKGTTRTCAKVPNNVKDPCDYLKQDVDPKFKVHSCYACETDKCNAASLLVSSGSGATIISTLFVVVLKQIF